jgi:hypothetical protein
MTDQTKIKDSDYLGLTTSGIQGLKSEPTFLNP